MVEVGLLPLINTIRSKPTWT